MDGIGGAIARKAFENKRNQMATIDMDWGWIIWSMR
jgi:hypothetical protein